MVTKKLIEVALPLDRINEAAAYEKMPGIGSHPRGIHLWWARRPFVVARSVIWASLVDDPSSHPELFPSEDDQIRERNRLFSILSDLAKWENSDNEEVLELARKEIIKYTNGNPPIVLDPFAGGGAIPLEAQRLGLEAYAHDLNPVSVILNKAMIEIPTHFEHLPPVNADSKRFFKSGWEHYSGLVEDIKYYSSIIMERAKRQIGHLYPQVMLSNGLKSTPVTWIWSRTVRCPNPACGCEVPLVSNFILCKKKGREAWVKPVWENGKFSFEVCHGTPEKGAENGTKQGKKASFCCPRCGNGLISGDYADREADEGRMGIAPVAVIAEGKRSKEYCTFSRDEADKLIDEINQYYEAYKIDEQVPHDPCRGTFASNAQGRRYGIYEFKDYFTKRQLIALCTISDLIKEVSYQVEMDAISSGFKDDHLPLKDGGTGALAYAQAVSVYLAFAVDRTADFSTSVSRWSVSNEKAMNCFSKQSISITWDFPEVNILGNAVGGFIPIVDYICECIQELPRTAVVGHAKQHDAMQDSRLRNIMISTDPPYYDNICYSDLSDFFYVWLRKNLGDIYPDVFSTMLVPKTDELIATPYRFEGDSQKAKSFFETGMLEACCKMYDSTSDDIPVTIYYAYKQSEVDTKHGDNQVSSNGWETMLSAIIKAGFSITGTWPMRTEQTYRAISMGTNALASSIVLVCRKRAETAQQTTRRNLINALRRELRPALKKLQESNIAPVDLAQSAIGPGMGVFSQYRRVLEADGSEMSVRSALQVINEEIDLYFNEQVGRLDTASRFCVDLYTQCAYNDIKFGEAEVLANAKGTSIPMLASHGVLYAKAGQVHLFERDELPEKIDTNENNIWLLTQQLTRTMEKGGVNACAGIVFSMFGSNAESAKDLAYRLYTIAERKGWAEEAYAYNNLVVAWPDIQTRAAELKAVQPKQMTFFDLGMI